MQNDLVRGGAVVARWAHNPKVVGSNPAPATKTNSLQDVSPAFFVFASTELVLGLAGTKKQEPQAVQTIGFESLTFQDRDRREQSSPEQYYLQLQKSKNRKRFKLLVLNSPLFRNATAGSNPAQSNF